MSVCVCMCFCCQPCLRNQWSNWNQWSNSYHIFLKVLNSFPRPLLTSPLNYFSFSLSLKSVIDVFYFTYFYIPPTLHNEHAVHGALLAQYKWTVIIIIITFDTYSDCLNHENASRILFWDLEQSNSAIFKNTPITHLCQWASRTHKDMLTYIS